MNIITGEKIQLLCDYYIGSIDDFKFNPIITNQIHKQIDIDNYDIKNINQLHIDNIFCYTHLINGETTNYSQEKCKRNIKNLLTILENINTSFNIFFHNSDSCLKEYHINLLNISNLKYIYTQNLYVKPNQKINPLPIGIANSMWKHGNLDIWNKIIEKFNFYNKKQLVYFNFNINTNTKKRLECYNSIISKNIKNVPNTDYFNYLQILSCYKFAICPEGNGLDTHRLWECLYLMVIPICLKNELTQHFSKYFPIVLLDSWNDLTIQELNKIFDQANWENYKLLDLNNFLNSIKFKRIQHLNNN